MTPAHAAAELFGLYTLAGKITVFVCPLLFGLFTELAGSQRAGLVVVNLFLIAGIVTIRPLAEPPAGETLSET